MLLADGREIAANAAGRTRQVYLVLELAVFFIVLPTLYMYFRPILLHPFPVVLCFAALCAWILKQNGGLSKGDLLGAYPGKRKIIQVLARFVVVAFALGVFVVLFEADKLLAFPRKSPVLWLTFVLVYPILSVVPQGMIYRVFFFRRYRELFGNGWTMIAASGLVFSYAHIIYRNPIALILTLVGGFFFAHTHARSSSPWFSSMEHALYGDFVFTIGLGYYIYSGVVR